MEDEQPVRRSKRWIFLTCLVLLGAALSYAIFAIRAPSFTFIDRFHGKLEDIPPGTLFPTDKDFVLEVYAFPANLPEIRKAFETEALQRGWTKMPATPKGVAFSEPIPASASIVTLYESTEFALLDQDFPWHRSGQGCNFVFHRRKAWLERQYERVKGWLGIKKAEPEGPYRMGTL